MQCGKEAMKILNPIVQHYAGSLSYGTSLPTSDVDIRGIFCAEPKSIRTPFFPVREVTLEDQEDGKLYELSNFMKLYTEGNPNILETLWVDNPDIIQGSAVYDLLCSHREELLSSKVAFTFSGYAVSQLKRIKGHNKWISNPQPKQKPRHKEFLKMVQNFTDDKVLPRDFKVDEYFNGHSLVHYGSDTYGILAGHGVSVLDGKGDLNLSVKQVESRAGVTQQPKIIFRYLADEYRQAKERHTNYWTWKDNRNTKRSALEEEFGYDCKHAMHLVRLLRMGEEVLSGKGVIVKRPDAQELLSIRNGAWSYEKLLAYAESKDTLIREVLYKSTSLPKYPNIKLASKVLMQAQDMCWH
jgi:predicted nucleotidyltransferase